MICLLSQSYLEVVAQEVHLAQLLILNARDRYSYLKSHHYETSACCGDMRFLSEEVDRKFDVSTNVVPCFVT